MHDEAGSPHVRVHRSRARWFVFAGSAALWLCAYVYLSMGAVPRAFSDTDLMRNIAAKPLRFPDLLFESKPFLYPLALRAFGDNVRLLVAVQTVVYFAAFGSWLWLASTRPRQLWAAAVLALATVNFALYPEFAAWNHIVLSESFATSLVTLAAACLWRALERRRWLWLWLATLFACTTVRDFTGYYCLALVPLALALRGLRRLGTLSMLATILFLGGDFYFAFYCADHTGKSPIEGRWVFEMLNNVGQRILPDEALTQTMVAHGMPMSPALERRRGTWAHDDDLAFYRDPELEDFRRWLVTEGKKAYGLTLLQHPQYAVESFWDRKEDVLQWSVYTAGFYPDAAYKKRTVVRIEHKWLHAANVALLLWLATLAWRRRSRARVFLTLVCAWFYLCLWPLAFFAFHADAMEIGRHCLPIWLQSVLALMFSALCLAAWREPRPVDEPPAPVPAA
ncbi:MAG: hypothetical protein R3F56_20855 [Planctomycetota bacterium]